MLVSPLVCGDVVCGIKEKVENRKEWGTWKPRTCLIAEH